MVSSIFNVILLFSNKTFASFVLKSISSISLFEFLLVIKISWSRLFINSLSIAELIIKLPNLWASISEYDWIIGPNFFATWWTTKIDKITALIIVVSINFIFQKKSLIELLDYIKKENPQCVFI